jgi:hypothetical protein
LSLTQKSIRDAHLTLTVETAKSHSLKIILKKWDKNPEMHLVFCVPNNSLAIFEPVDGDLYEHFSNQVFSDNLVEHFLID